MALIVSKVDLKISKTVDDLSLYPESNWYHDPDLSAVEGVLEKYWMDDGEGNIVEMLAGEKALVDTGLLDKAKQQARAHMSLDCDDYVESNYRPSKQVYLVMRYCKAIQEKDTTKQDEVKLFVVWMESVYDYEDTKSTEINACKTAAAAEAVTWDFSQFNPTKPTSE